METIIIYEVVKKLIGKIKPIGETNIDNTRFNNLKILTELVDKLIYDIDSIIPYKNKPEHSMKKAGNFADKFFDNLGITE